MRYLPLLAIIVLAFRPLPAFAEEAPADREGIIDRSHAFLDREINDTVDWFDDLFGESDKPDHPMHENYLKWSNDLRAEKGEGIRYRTSLRARIRLPKFQDRLRLVILEENRDEAVAPIPSDPGTPAVNTPARSNSFRAANTELRYYARDSDAGSIFLAAGSRFVWPPNTFVRGRFLWRHRLSDNTLIVPSATPFWQDHIGFGITPQLDIGHPLPQDHHFLWTNSVTAFAKRPGFLWGSEVSVSRILSPISAIAYSVGASGATRPGADTNGFGMGANNYRTAVRYRRTIYRPWLFFELIPETNWRRDDAGGREFVPAFTVRLEMNSLGSRALLPAPLIVKEKVPIPERELY
ncbi:MAG TPA: hypothetical protein VIU29_00320 [Candidatus Deferrimicrobiaceae bacterium]